MKSISDVAPKVRGRPRSFDRAEALERAVELFWRKGYEGTTIGDLTAAMGISPPSLYAAFGDKERLYREAIERYTTGPGGDVWRILDEEPAARRAIARLLEEIATMATSPDNPPGCMVVASVMNCSAPSPDLQAALAEHRAAAGKALKARIERSVEEGELSRKVDAASLAGYFATVIQGITVQARDGATREALLAVAKTAMRAWPDE